MPTISTLLLFSLAAFTLIIVPGPAVLYVVARSIEQGRIAGIVSVLGVSVGAFVHTLAAALGISAILMTSAMAFAAVKYLGAFYLIYLGIQTLRKPLPDNKKKVLESAPLHEIFLQGIVVNVLNPKGALFFFAFLPQFVDPTLSAAWIQITIFGLIFVLIALFSDSLYAVLAGTLGNALRENRRFWQGQKYFSGGIYILLGCVTAFTGNHRD